MRQFEVGRYTYTASHRRNSYHVFSLHSAYRSDLVDSVKNYDHTLHQSLDKIFRQSYPDISSGQIRELLCSPQLKSIIKPILEQEPSLSRYFSKEELEKLSLLWIAVLVGYTDSAELLVRSGADVNELFGLHDPQMIDEKWTVLHLLIQMDHSPENERLIRLVIDHGADLQAQDCKGQTVLHYAMRESRFQMTEMLLEKGADVNAADNEGMTPLLAAVTHSRKANQLLPLLTKHGADVFAKSKYGQNALHHLACVIWNHNVDRTVEVAKFLIEKGVSIDEGSSKHYQPIHWAAKYKHNELVEFFLDHGADVNALTEDKESPLILAAEHDAITVVKTLLKRGANIHLRTNAQLACRTALHAACKASGMRARNFENYQRESTIGLLLFAGADVLAEDRMGYTPFTLTSSSRRIMLAEDYDHKMPFTLFTADGSVKNGLMIEALALRKALQPTIELKDEVIIERHQKLRDYYQKCTDEIDRMKSTRVVGTCTFFQILAKGRCQIAELMRNPEFETKFKQFDLSVFSKYAKYVVRDFERAREHYRSLLEQADVINEAVYNVLPYLVVKKVVHCILNCCENVK